MKIHAITAFFDDRAYADEAVSLLKQAGLSDQSVTLSPPDARDEFATFDPLNGGEPRRKGFWGMLEDLFGGSDDQHLYAEGIRRGSIMLTAQVDDERLDRAVEILDRHGSIDLDEREISWRNEGWLGGSAGMPFGASVLPDGLGLDTMTAAAMLPVEPVSVPVVEPGSSAASSPVGTPILPSAVEAEPAMPRPAEAATVLGDANVLQVVEERLVVGKRAVSRGKVRIHSYMVEKPVTEEIRLRDETIRIDRQAVDRTISQDDLQVAGFQDRTIEMEEVDEEAVVNKTARLVEEIGLRKDVSNRTETIHDSLRSTKVAIEDGRDTAAVDEREAERLQTTGSPRGVPIKPA